ncbi:MAG: alpha/beta hydrolase [Anaerolineae bacterium]
MFTSPLGRGTRYAFRRETQRQPNIMSIPPIEIAPELRPQMGKIPHVPVANAFSRRVVRFLTKLSARTWHYDGVTLEKRQTEGGVGLRLFTPVNNRSGAALLWIHGGGMVIGTAAQDDRLCAETARALGIVVVSTEYRLAPEHPFPAAIEDCLAAWSWLVESASALQVNPARLAIGGESAGGGLAAALVQRVHDAGGPQPVAQWLFCPMLDDRTAARRELDVLNHPIWNNAQNRIGWRCYLGVEPGADLVPEYAVPARRENLSGLPPAWIGAGDIELFYAEAKTYADRLTAAGVECVLDIVPGAPHGFEKLAADTTLTQNYLARARAWLQTQVVP